MGFSFLKRETGARNPFLVLDIGTEAVKSLICYYPFLGKEAQKENPENNKKITVLASSVEYFDKYGFFGSRDLEMDITKKAVKKAIDSCRRRLFLSPFAEKNLKKNILLLAEQKRWPALLTLSPDKIKAKIIRENFTRKDESLNISLKEEKRILEDALESAREKIGQIFTEETGILPSEIYWISSKILEKKIDGYPVSALSGYKGKSFDFKILAVFLPRRYFEEISRMARSLGLDIIKILHLSECLPSFCQNYRESGTFFDIGGELIQSFTIEQGKLQQVGEFKGGGKDFTRKLCLTLGIDEETARDLKEKYEKDLLEPGVKKKIKKMFKEEQDKCRLSLREKMEDITKKDFFLFDIYFFGGGALLSEMREALEAGIGLGEKDSSLDLNEAKLIYPKDFKNIEAPLSDLENSQLVPSFLIISQNYNYAQKNI